MRLPSMLDLRDVDHVLERTSEALGRFEKGGPAPIGTGELFVDLSDALLDSGPMELHVSASRYPLALDATTRALAVIRNRTDSTQSAAREAQRALKNVQKLLKEAVRSARRPQRDPATRTTLVKAALISCLVVAFLVMGQLTSDHRSALVPGIAFGVGVIAYGVLSDRWSEAAQSYDASAIASTLTLPERVIFGARLVNEKRQFVLATDRRLLLAIRDGSHTQHTMSVPYGDILGVVTTA